MKVDCEKFQMCAINFEMKTKITQQRVTDNQQMIKKKVIIKIVKTNEGGKGTKKRKKIIPRW